MNYNELFKHKFVPVVVFNDLSEVEPKLSAMRQGGVKIAEITFRTECASEAIKLATRLFPDMLIGAGTILNSEMCKKAISSGAKFVVSPGVSCGVAAMAQNMDVPYIPGVATPTEIMQALDLGLTYLKFFPCDIFGGIKTLTAYSQVFRNVRFMATGGVSLQNIKEYLALPYMQSVGGSFVLKGNEEEICNNCKKICKIVEELKI